MNSSETPPVNPSISIVCPIYNEELVLEAFFARIIPALEKTRESFEVVCVNDGSTDTSLAKLISYQHRDPRIRVIDLSRNFGKEAALTCGIDHARGDAVVPIDADLQDPPELIGEMISVWRQGFDVILMVRVDRSSDGLLKRKTAEWFYRLHNAISDPVIPANAGDFRLMDRKVVNALKQFSEQHRFMKGLFAWVGFRQATIPYSRDSRYSGMSKFSAWQLWNFALEGITSFSTTPLKIWTYLGFTFASGAFLF